MNDVKVVVVGAGGVGKSALTICFVQNHFVVDYDPTIEDSYRKQITVDDVPCFLNILDTAGQEEYSAMRDMYMRKGDGFLLVFSLTARATYEEVQNLHNKILEVKDTDKVPLVLAANKWDLQQEHEVTKTEAEGIAKTIGAELLLTSAKDHYNVDECFIALIRLIRNDPKAVKKKSKGCSIL